MYGEEVELFIRLRQKTGKKAYYANSSSITHLGSVSTKKDNASRLVYELKSIEYIYTKHYPHLLWFIRFILYTGVTMRIVLFSLLPGRRDSVLEYKKFINT
jgi:GT2 family glycosyltransferase